MLTRTIRLPAMTTRTSDELIADASAWWDTAIIDIHPGKIAIRGYPIEQLIGRVRFPEMIWLMLRGELPSREQGELLEAALVPGVDHGPHAPSIAIARMAVTCGLPVNGAMASAINVLDDIHGGAGQQCMELYREIDAEAGPDGDLVRAATVVIERHREGGRKDRSGFRSSLSPGGSAHSAVARAAGESAGTRYGNGPLCGYRSRVERAISALKKRHIPMNIDGITAVFFASSASSPSWGAALYPVACRRHTRACLGAEAGRTPPDGADAARDSVRYSGPALRSVPPR
jgi:citrate synthase